MAKAKIKKDAAKIDDKCESFLYNHCLLTQSAHGCAIVQRCNTAAAYCKVKCTGSATGRNSMADFDA